MFSEVSVCSKEKGLDRLPPIRGTPLSRCRPPLEADPPEADPPSYVLTSSGGHCNGQYASYWNAFLFKNSCWQVTITYQQNNKYVLMSRNMFPYFSITNSSFGFSCAIRNLQYFVWKFPLCALLNLHREIFPSVLTRIFSSSSKSSSSRIIVITGSKNAFENATWFSAFVFQILSYIVYYLVIFTSTPWSKSTHLWLVCK